eukprot:5644934-Amphidinium_carterae.1
MHANQWSNGDVRAPTFEPSVLARHVIAVEAELFTLHWFPTDSQEPNEVALKVGDGSIPCHFRQLEYCA